MPRVFISNTKVQKTENADIIVNTRKGIVQLFTNTMDKSGNTIYIIDVHCTFKGTVKMQEYGGIKIVDYLRRLFMKRLDFLKIIIYSPIPKSYLVRLKAANTIVDCLPFVEVNGEPNQFENDLTKIVEDYTKGALSIKNCFTKNSS